MYQLWLPTTIRKSKGEIMPKVDTREPSDITTPLIRAGWTPEALPSGDFELQDVVGEIVLIERKTVSQLLTDLQSGQLQRQCRVLVESSSFPILLLEGHWQQQNGHLLDTRYTWEQVWNALQTLQDLGCRLQITTSIQHSIQRLFELAEYYSKEFHASIARSPSGDVYVACLSLIHGISAAKALELKALFPDLASIANADQKAISQVPGIGSKLANRIYEFWRK